MAQSDGSLEALHPGPPPGRPLRIPAPGLAPGSIFREPAVALLLFGIVIGLAVFVLYPLALVFRASLLGEAGTFSFARFRELFSSGNYLVPFLNSLKLGAATALAGTAVGYTLAYIVTLTAVPGKGLLRFIARLPMVSPPFMVALATIMLLGRNGVITRLLIEPVFGAAPSIYGFPGLLIVETLTYFPTAFLLLCGVFAAIDPVLEEAAQSQGAGRLAVFRDVIFPLTLPAIFSSLLLLFIESLADFGNPLVLSGDFKVLCVEAYLKITGEFDMGGGAALAVLLLAPSIVAFLGQRYLAERHSYATLSGKPSSASGRAPRGQGAGRFLALGIAGLVAAVVLGFYASVIYGSLVKTWGVDGTFTFENYRMALAESADALRDSLWLAALATPLTVGVGMLTAYVLVRKRFLGRGILELASMLTFAVPGTVVGIAYVLAFNGPPLKLTGTAAIILALLIFRNAPLAVQSGMTAIRQIDRAIEEGSASLGASSLTTFWRVILPLVAPAVFSGMAQAFVRSITAISAVIFVVSSQWNLVTVSILGFVENSQLSRASAMCMILVVLASAVLAGMEGILIYWRGGGSPA